MSGDLDRAQVRLAELVAALSLGIDLGFGQPMEHVLRQCLIALRLAERLGLDERAAGGRLLHGAARQRRLPLRRARAGEVVRRRHRAEVEQVRPRAPQPARDGAAACGCLGAGNPPLHRFRVGLEFALSGHREVDGMIAQHAALARSLAEQLGLPEAVLEALGAAYEQWDGRGWPGELQRRRTSRSRRGSRSSRSSSRSRTGSAASTAVERAGARARSGKQFDPRARRARLRRRRTTIFAGLDDGRHAGTR